MDLGKISDYLMVELAEPLTRGWPLIDTPFPIMIITAAYIYFVLYAGPHYMKNRSPFNLRVFILFYNLFQILTNAWIVKEHLSAGWLTEYSLNIKCSIDTNNPNGFKLLTIMWWTLVLKLIDYIETCVFVLRKKQDQVSILHVYHHVFTVFFAWCYLKYVADPTATVCSLINCSVHVIMYIYYFAAAWSPKFQRAVSLIKPYLTKIQMIQFVGFIVLLVKNVPDPKCKILLEKTRLTIAYIFVFNLLTFLYLFYNFHKKTYGKTSKQKNAKEEE